MDGDPATRLVIVSGRIGWPNGMAVDYTLQRIYWADARYVLRLTLLLSSTWLRRGCYSCVVLKQRLFFNRLKKIESSNYDGTDRRRIASILPQHPFGLGVFESTLYYTDWYKYGKGIRKLNKFTGQERHKIRPTLWSHMDIHVYHPLRQANGKSLDVAKSRYSLFQSHVKRILKVNCICFGLLYYAL